jgi:hypothetical protein
MDDDDLTVASRISLGSHLLTARRRREHRDFATNWTILYFSRIFEFGGDLDEYILMTWTRELEQKADTVRWWDGEMVTVTDSNAPYALGDKYHILMVPEPGAGSDNTLRVSWYTAKSSSRNIIWALKRDPSKQSIPLRAGRLTRLAGNIPLQRRPWPMRAITKSEFGTVCYHPRIWSCYTISVRTR